MVLNIVLNLWLIPPFSYIGASWSWFTTNVFALLAGFWLVRSVVEYRVKSLLLSAARISLAVIIMGWLIVFLKSLLPLIVVVAVGGLVYGLALFIFKELKAVDLRFLWQLFRKQSADSSIPAIGSET